MVYLIHFERHFGHARHYLGYVDRNLDRRIKRHRANDGAKLLRAVNLAGIAWSVVRTWPDATRDDERRLKNGKNSAALCPACREESTMNKGKGG